MISLLMTMPPPQKKKKKKLIKKLKGIHPFAMLQSCGQGGEDGIERVIVRLLMHHHMGLVSLLSLGNVNLAWARTNVHTIEQVFKLK